MLKALESELGGALSAPFFSDQCDGLLGLKALAVRAKADTQKSGGAGETGASSIFPDADGDIEKAQPDGWRTPFH